MLVMKQDGWYLVKAAWLAPVASAKCSGRQDKGLESKPAVAGKAVRDYHCVMCNV